MLHAPGLVGVAAADIAEIAAAVAKTKTSRTVARTFVLILSLLLWLSARFGRRGDGDEVRLRAGRQDVDDVEVDPVWARDRAVDVAEAAVDEALARVVRRLATHSRLGVLVRHRSLDDFDECRPRVCVPTRRYVRTESYVLNEDIRSLGRDGAGERRQRDLFDRVVCCEESRRNRRRFDLRDVVRDRGAGSRQSNGCDGCCNCPPSHQLPPPFGAAETAICAS